MPIDFVKRFRPPEELSRLSYNEAYIERMKVEAELKDCENPDRKDLLLKYHETILACGPQRLG